MPSLLNHLTSYVRSVVRIYLWYFSFVCRPRALVAALPFLFIHPFVVYLPPPPTFQECHTLSRLRNTFPVVSILFTLIQDVGAFYSL